MIDAIPVEPEDGLLSSYAYELPKEQIAQHPGERGASRLMVVDRRPVEGSPLHARFADLPDLLPEGAVLVVNSSRVVPARLLGVRPSGGRAEFLLLTPLPLLRPELSGVWAGCEVEGLVRPGKRIHPGDELDFAPGEGGEARIRVRILEKGDFGRVRAAMSWRLPQPSGGGTASPGSSPARDALRLLLEATAHLPLPPYIRRPDTAEDARRYQTVYARAGQEGSVAAPTAGLHFTEAMRERLRARGFGWLELSLHVGYGTFSPVRCAHIDDHQMHAEQVEISAATAAALVLARKEGRPVVAVGTTSARALEGMAPLLLEGRPASGPVRIFIRPGYRFSLVDGLITNFHLPESTLLMLVSALVGRKRLLNLYAEAVREGYRFFSYGDAMLVR